MTATNALADALDQSFDWTRRFRPDVRAALTTWLEVGDRAFTGTTQTVPGGAR
ncbi:hypothetical protein [Nonomuraea sp. bgisy094]|uniref:hypothetical protein n=1 Tax=Nonomuraea sp. bgisy094 TaxID=3413781 RepID=UPI003EBB231F